MKPEREQVKALASRLHVDSGFLELCLEEEALSWPAGTELPSGAGARLRRLQRLCRSLDVDAFAGALILNLVERLEAAERELDLLRARKEPYAARRH